MFVLSCMSDVEILYRVFEFTFSMIYKTTAKNQLVVSRRSLTLFLKFRSLNVNSASIGLTEFCIHISRLSWYAHYSEYKCYAFKNCHMAYKDFSYLHYIVIF